MKILNVTVLLDAASGGGTAERTFQLSRSLVAKGHDVTVLTTDIGLTEERIASLTGVTVVGLPCLLKRFFVVLPRLFLISALVKRADAIHLMGHWNLLNVIVFMAATLWGKPYAVCPAGELRVFGRSSLLKRLFNRLVGYRIIRGASAWIAITADENVQYEQYGVPPEKVSVIPNGIVAKDLLVEESTDILGRVGVTPKNYILFMGRLNPIKGPDLLLGAFARAALRYPELKLVFAGPDGGLLEALKIKVGASGLAGRVIFAGYVAGGDKATLYRQARLLVIPSRHEAMSIVVLEAGVVSVPVLLTDQCGFDDVQRTGGGMVVEASMDPIEHGLIQLMDSPELLPEMGERLHRMVMGKYTWEIAVQRHEQLFAAVVEARSDRRSHCL